MTAALVNADYEFQLFREELGDTTPERMKRNRQGLEFMFFFANQDPRLTLKTEQSYPTHYRDYLASLGVDFPTLTAEGPSFNWYGQLANIPLEKRLNSKLWGYQQLVQLQLNRTPFMVVEHIDEVRRHLKSGAYQSWLLKSPFHMAGLGFHHLTDEASTQGLNLTHRYILEPYLERLLDLVQFYCPHTKRLSYYLCRTSKTGSYVGGILFQTLEELSAHIASLGFARLLPEYFQKSERLLQLLRAEPLQQPLTIDSFIFQGPNGAELHIGCDINYRQSMGTLLLSLQRFLPAHGVGEFLHLSPLSGLKHYELLPYSPSEKSGVLYLSPPGCNMQALFFCGPTLSAVERLKSVFFHSLQG